MTKNEGFIEVYGARVHNLKNIDVSIPRELTCSNYWLSGSGKSSLLSIPFMQKDNDGI